MRFWRPSQIVMRGNCTSSGFCTSSGRTTHWWDHLDFIFYCLIACHSWHLWKLMSWIYFFRWSQCWWTSLFGPRSWTVRPWPTGCSLLKWLMISPGIRQSTLRHTYMCRWGDCSWNWFTFIGPMQVLCVGDSSFNHPEDEQARAEDPKRAGWGKRKAGEATEQKGRWETHLLTAKSCVHMGFAIPIFRTDCPPCYFFKGLSCIICLGRAVNIWNVYIGCCINAVGVVLRPTGFLIQQ